MLNTIMGILPLYLHWPCAIFIRRLYVTELWSFFFINSDKLWHVKRPIQCHEHRPRRRLAVRRKAASNRNRSWRVLSDVIDRRLRARWEGRFPPDTDAEVPPRGARLSPGRRRDAIKMQELRESARHSSAGVDSAWTHSHGTLESSRWLDPRAVPERSRRRFLPPPPHFRSVKISVRGTGSERSHGRGRVGPAGAAVWANFGKLEHVWWTLAAG